MNGFKIEEFRGSILQAFASSFEGSWLRDKRASINL